MLAAVFHGPNNIAVREVPFANGRAALKVNACAVCGYDARVFRNGHSKVSPPVILGHELCGETLETVRTGDGTMIRAGSRVAVSPLIPCLECHHCGSGRHNLCMRLKEIGSTLDGGFAQYVGIPEQITRIGGLVPVPDNLGDEEAALLEPLACCLNGLSRTGPLAKGSPVVIIGDGPIGLMHLQLIKRSIGANVAMVGKIASRMQKAKAMEADAVFAYQDSGQTARELLDFTGTAGASVVIVTTSNPEAFELATKVAGKNSAINLFAGMPRGQRFALDPNWLHYNQISLTGTFSSTPSMLREAARVAAEKTVELSGIVTHRYQLAEIGQAMQATENYHGLRAVINKF